MLSMTGLEPVTQTFTRENAERLPSPRAAHFRHLLAVMGGEHVAGEIQRAADQDARRRRGERGLAECGFEARCGFGGKALIARRLRQRFGRDGILLVGNGDASPRGCAMPAKAAMKLAASLVLSMPQISTSGREWRSLRSAKACASTRPADGIVAAVEPEFGVCAAACARQRARAQPLHARRPDRGSSPAAMARSATRGVGQRAERRDRGAGIVDLVAADAAAAAAGRAGRPRPGTPAGRAARRPASPGPAMAAARRRASASRSITARASSGCGADDGRARRA